jgi:hypothetical protein
MKTTLVDCNPSTRIASLRHYSPSGTFHRTPISLSMPRIIPEAEHSPVCVCVCDDIISLLTPSRTPRSSGNHMMDVLFPIISISLSLAHFTFIILQSLHSACFARSFGNVINLKYTFALLMSARLSPLACHFFALVVFAFYSLYIVLNVLVARLLVRCSLLLLLVVNWRATSGDDDGDDYGV